MITQRSVARKSRGFAVIDLETTGLHTPLHRIVEVGIILVNTYGEIEGEWTSLVNPQRDVSAKNIHGISGRDVADAPIFSDIVDWITYLLQDRIVVAHNASFDMRFLAAEFTRARRPTPPVITLEGTRLPSLCTMRWAQKMKWPPKLNDCCSALGIRLDDAHNALADARATANLLIILLHNTVNHHEMLRQLDIIWSHPWPTAPTTVREPKVSLRKEPPPVSEWIEDVINAVPIPGKPFHEADYLMMLRMALLDLHISVDEKNSLATIAAGLGVDRPRLMILHQRYLEGMALEALADGVVTAEERTDLDRVALILGLPDGSVAQALEEMSVIQRSRSATQGQSPLERFALQRGDRIVLTGEMRVKREEWISRLTDAGLHSGGVTKSTRVLVAGDPDSLSGKAVLARRYNVPIVSEDALERLFADFLSSENKSPLT